MTLTTPRISLRIPLGRGQLMLASTALTAVGLTIFLGAWAISDDLDARRVAAAGGGHNAGGYAAGAGEADAIEPNRVEKTFLFLCPLH